MSEPASPARPSVPVPPAQPQKSNVVLWVLGILAAAVVLFGLGAFIAVTYVARAVQVNQAGNKVEIQTPVGSIKASKDAAPDTGLPVYPGSTVSESGADVELGVPDEETVKITAAHYRTIDPIGKVDAWYAERLGDEFKREGPGVHLKKKDVIGTQLKSDDIAFVSEKGDFVRVVALKKQFNGVEIVLLRIGKSESQ